MSNNIEWKTEQRQLKELVPASYNPRRLTDKQYQDLKKSLEKFSLAEIPVINLDNKILAGHMRIKILIDLKGLDEIIDVRVPNRQLTEDEEKEYNIRSNKNIGEWDFEILANEFDVTELVEWGFKGVELGNFEGIVVNNDPLSEWENMPSYTNKERGFKSIVVHFKEEQDVKDFEQIINQKISEATRFIWFPKREREDLDSLSY